MTTNSTAIIGNEGVVGDVAGLPALIPFSGAISASEVRQQMVGPILSGPPMAIWRKTTIVNSTPDGAFSLYACERTGQAMWVPSGEYFVADKPRGAQPRGTVMDYLSFQRPQTGRPSGYTQHSARQVPQPRRHLTSIVRHRPIAAATGPRYNPIGPAPPRPAGSGTRRTITRRERRSNGREASSRHTQALPATQAHVSPPPLPNSSTGEPVAPPTPPSTVAPSSATESRNASPVVSNTQSDHAKNKKHRISELNLSDLDDDIS